MHLPSLAADYITVHPNGRIQVYNILDAESFVYSCAGRQRLAHLDYHERQDLLSEGLVILLDLACKYNPAIGSFSGFCSRFLPGKISSAWHKMHPEHLQVIGEDGKRIYQYGERDASLEAELARGDNNGIEQPTVRAIGNFVRPRTTATPSTSKQVSV